jgi:2-keto-4-pentenoate hydratase/2-oxohepta-3-ene-1,7-dioic acid hydratase in catechol pathway
LSWFEPVSSFNSLDNLEIEFMLSDIIRQRGSSSQMLFDIAFLVEYISTFFTLKPGDIVLTGTPKGVGPLHPGDMIQIKLRNHISFQTTIIEKSP